MVGGGDVPGFGISEEAVVMVLHFSVELAGELFAGFHEVGLMVSADDGLTWLPETGISARHFEWIEFISEDVFAEAERLCPPK